MTKVKRFTENKLGKDYVVGDIHGCFDKLTSELEAIGFDGTKDRLFSVGDLVDRGPSSEEALDWLAKPWFHAVRGNHEQMAIDYANGEGYSGIYSYNGGQWMIDLPEARQKVFAKVFDELPIAIEISVGDKIYGIIHAEVPAGDWALLSSGLCGNSLQSASYENTAMWSRDKYNSVDKSLVSNVELVYVGHTPAKEIAVLGNVVYIDQGACFGRKLTVLEMY